MFEPKVCTSADVDEIEKIFQLYGSATEQIEEYVYRPGKAIEAAGARKDPLRIIHDQSTSRIRASDD